jgi:hypothetical protein
MPLRRIEHKKAIADALHPPGNVISPTCLLFGHADIYPSGLRTASSILSKVGSVCRANAALEVQSKIAQDLSEVRR